MKEEGFKDDVKEVVQEVKGKLVNYQVYSRQLFKVEESTFIAACSSLDSTLEYTKDEIKNHIAKWLKKEVK